MKTILGGINGVYLRDILDPALDETETVLAAVAYASDRRLLDWCWDNKIPLKFYGRFDNQVPISIPILETFLNRKSAQYECRLVKHFHPKVIWWKGHGIYIGSANLSDKAWHKNVEAGCFFTEAEMSENGLDIEMTEFFRFLDTESFILSQETVDILKKRKGQISKSQQDDKANADKVENITSVKQWDGLGVVSKSMAHERGRQAFLEEWYSTLTILRQIADVVGRPENRPVWISPNTPAAWVADQFLHAHYYENTFDDRRANYEHFFEQNKSDPDDAVIQALKWWKDTPGSPGSEGEMLNVSAPTVGKIVHIDNIDKIVHDDWEVVVSTVHSMADHARRMQNDKLGLKDGKSHRMNKKATALSIFQWEQVNRKGQNVVGLLKYVLYGGSDDELPNRIWNATKDPALRIPHIGLSAFGEITGWAIPEKYPPRNRRTSKALRSLGFDVRVH